MDDITLWLYDGDDVKLTLPGEDVSSTPCAGIVVMVLAGSHERKSTHGCSWCEDDVIVLLPDGRVAAVDIDDTDKLSEITQA